MSSCSPAIFVSSICLCTPEDLFDCYFMALSVPMVNSVEKYISIDKLCKKWPPFRTAKVRWGAPPVAVSPMCSCRRRSTLRSDGLVLPTTCFMWKQRSF